MTIKTSFSLFSFILLSACGALPNAGPMSGNIRSLQTTPNVKMIQMTPALSIEMAKNSKISEDAAENAAIQSLQGTHNTGDIHLALGDMLKIKIWSMSPLPGKSATSSGPDGAELGKFQIDANGMVNLPYAGHLHIAGMTPNEAQDAIAQHYIHNGILMQPQVSLELASANNISNSILVTGAIGKPKLISWTPGGVDLGQAITSALGDGTSVFGQNLSDNANQKDAISIDVKRNLSSTTLSMNTALENHIPLQPGDRVIVHKASTVQVSVLGGGIMKNGTYGFASTPTLTEVLGQAQGINPSTADNTGLFVFHRNADNSFSVYDFAWNKSASIIAAQTFPIQNHDIIYVSESTIVPITRVMNMIFTLMLPASLARP